MATRTPRKATQAPATVATLEAACLTLAPAIAVTPRSVDGNGSQRSNSVSIHGISISSLTRALAATGASRLLIMAAYAALKLPVSPATVKAQYGSGKTAAVGEAGHHNTTPDYTQYPEALRNGLQAVFQALCNDEQASPGTLTKLSKQLKPGLAGPVNPAAHLPAFMRQA